MQPLTAKAEWKSYWMLPIAAALGYATSVIHIYGLSPYVVPVAESFGWGRATVTFGLTIATLIQALFGVPRRSSDRSTRTLEGLKPARPAGIAMMRTGPLWRAFCRTTVMSDRIGQADARQTGP